MATLSQTIELQEVIFKGPRFTLYKAKRHNITYIVKVAEEGKQGELLLKNEYFINKILNHIKGVRKVYEIFHYRGLDLALLLEYVPYGSLRELIREGGKLSVENFLKAAINITETLVEIHKNNVIHKDINPTNILIDGNSFETKIIDFSVSEIFSISETDLHKGLFVGTYEYVAPEQTGRLNAVVDFRADLYSLGATFYYMLTGRPPFKEKEKDLLIYYHLTKKPEPVNKLNPEVPNVIAKIINKLLEKRPEKRYQSAKPLLDDLRKAYSQLQQKGNIEDFEIAEQDIPTTLIFSTKDYGYEKEEKILYDTFNTILEGLSSKKWIQINSHLDYGAKTFVRRLQHKAFEHRGVFIETKLKPNIHSPLNAITSVITKLFNEYAEDNPVIIRKIEQQVLVPNESLIPYIKLQLPFISKFFPALTSKGITVRAVPNDIQQELIKLYEEFIKIFTEEFPIVVISIYNIEFADKLSIKFIRKLIRNDEIKKLLLITVNFYQQSNTNFNNLLEFVKEHFSDYLVEITLQGHSLKDIIAFIRDTFKVSETEAETLSHLLVAKYGKGFGNIKRALKELYSIGAIYYSPEKKKWIFDFDKIKQQEESSDVYKFYERKLVSLPDASQTILKIASVFGIVFNVGDLYKVLGISFQSFKEHFGYLIKSGIIEVSVQYWDEIKEEELEEVSASFSSITLVEKIASEIPEAEKKRYYHRIASYLLENLSHQQLRERAFELVKYLTYAKDLFRFDQKLMEFLLEAAFIASTEGEDEVAYNAITTLISIGGTKLWEKLPNIAENAYLLYSKITIEQGKIDEFYKVVKILTAKKLPRLEIAGLLLVGIDKLTERGEFDLLHKIAKDIIPTLFKEYVDPIDKIQNIPKALNELKFRFFTTNILGGLKSVFSFGKKRGKNPMEELAIANIERLLELPDVKNPEVDILMKILSRMILPFYAKNVYLSVWSLNQLIKLGLKYGNNAAAVAGYTGFGAFLTSSLDSDLFPAYFIWQVAEELSKRYPNEKSDLILMKIFAIFYIAPWFENITKNLPAISRLYNEAITENEFFYAGYIAVFDIIHNLLSTTSLSNLETICTYYQTQMEEVGIKEFRDILKFYKEWIRSVKDPSYKANVEEELPKNFIGYLMAFANQLKFFLKDIPNYSLTWAEKCRELEKYSLGSVAFIFSRYLYAITLLETGVLSESQKKDLKEIFAFLKRGGEYSQELKVKYEILNGLQLAYERQTDKAYNHLLNLYEEEKEHLLPINKIILMEKLLKVALLLNKEADAITFIYQLVDMYKKAELYYKLDVLATKYGELVPDIKLLVEDIQKPSLESGTQTTTTTSTTAVEKSIANIVEKLNKQISKGKTSEEIVITLVKNILLYSGMNKVILVRKYKDNLLVALDVETSNIQEIYEFKDIPILKYKSNVPISVISYVEQFKKPLVLMKNSPRYKSFQTDEYISKYNPTTLFVYPLVYGDKVLGVLYCEFTEQEASISEYEELIIFVVTYLSMYFYFIQEKQVLQEKADEDIRQLQEFIEELKKHNKLLTEKLRKLEDIIHENTEGLKYAARIQQAILKTPKQLKEVLPKSFVLWKPHSIVSGDFFYVWKQGNEYIIVTADCTGHGLGASQLTIAGTIFLNKVIDEQQVKSPSEILSLLDKYMYQALSNSEDQSVINEGMDVSVVYVNMDEKKMVYSGANAPIVYTDGEKLLGTSPTKMPIGSYELYGTNKKFKEKVIEITKETKVYMFSDGYRDQVGGAEATKLGKKLFYKLIYTVSKFPWDVQKRKLEEALKKWKGEHPQTDDIIIVGFKALQ